jgi:hypothetical protein
MLVVFVNNEYCRIGLNHCYIRRRFSHHLLQLLMLWNKVKSVLFLLHLPKGLEFIRTLTSTTAPCLLLIKAYIGLLVKNRLMLLLGKVGLVGPTAVGFRRVVWLFFRNGRGNMHHFFILGRLRSVSWLRVVLVMKTISESVYIFIRYVLQLLIISPFLASVVKAICLNMN